MPRASQNNLFLDSNFLLNTISFMKLIFFRIYYTSGVRKDLFFEIRRGLQLKKLKLCLNLSDIFSFRVRRVCKQKIILIHLVLRQFSFLAPHLKFIFYLERGRRASPLHLLWYLLCSVSNHLNFVEDHRRYECEHSLISTRPLSENIYI